MTTIINVLLILFLIWFLSSRLLSSKGVNQITTGDLKQRIKEKQVQFVDVRTPYEYKSNHIRQFQNIPLADLTKPNKLSKQKEVVVICQSGMRSNKASKILKKQGFEHVTNVKGGMSAWN